MATSTWKETERTVAKRLGGTRVGPSGTSTADVVNDHLAVECKHRKSLPVLITAAMAQAVGAARDGQTPIVVLHEKGKRHDNDIVCMRLKDYQDLYGSVGVLEEE
jgi:hypothetical protein